MHSWLIGSRLGAGLSSPASTHYNMDLPELDYVLSKFLRKLQRAACAARPSRGRLVSSRPGDPGEQGGPLWEPHTPLRRLGVSVPPGSYASALIRGAQGVISKSGGARLLLFD